MGMSFFIYALKHGASQDPYNRDVEQLGLIPIYRECAQPGTSRLSGSHRCIYYRAWEKKDMHCCEAEVSVLCSKI